MYIAPPRLPALLLRIFVSPLMVTLEYFAEIAPPNPPWILPFSSGAAAMAVFLLMVPDSISASE